LIPNQRFVFMNELADLLRLDGLAFRHITLLVCLRVIATPDLVESSAFGNDNVPGPALIFLRGVFVFSEARSIRPSFFVHTRPYVDLLEGKRPW